MFTSQACQRASVEIQPAQELKPCINYLYRVSVSISTTWLVYEPRSGYSPERKRAKKNAARNGNRVCQ